MPTNSTKCKLRVLEYLRRRRCHATAKIIARETGMQSNTAIKCLKFLLDEGHEIVKGWTKVFTVNGETRVRTYLLKERV